jgi:nucleotide-binding universal stress UspA family protein
MNLSEKNLILVAYDSSKESEKALEHAIDIADPEDEVQILMVIPKPESDPFINLDDFVSFTDAENELDHIIKIYNQDSKKVTTLIAQGNIIDEIIKASENPRCKLIVLGFKGITRIGPFKLGSISGEVAKHAKVPVLIVK